jgi:hypothetical protein
MGRPECSVRGITVQIATSNDRVTKGLGPVSCFPTRTVSAELRWHLLIGFEPPSPFAGWRKMTRGRD